MLSLGSLLIECDIYTKSLIIFVITYILGAPTVSLQLWAETLIYFIEHSTAKQDCLSSVVLLFAVCHSVPSSCLMRVAVVHV